ncbi:MAG: DUF2236 domain-containing protein [Chitinophagales bacterium]|nr:DUF2236 domain-containing protein [Chitinophagales bacterium]
MAGFVREDSIVRCIWGRSETVLFIFAGASAEFALNKAVDWLYFTGKLPADPLGRLFSTVAYAKKIVFASEEQAHAAIDTMRQIHSGVENKRGAAIPDWAYRDVLYMLIFYSIASFELLERKLTAGEKEEVYHVFFRLGARMGLKELPAGYAAWLADRELHLQNDLCQSAHTTDLFKQYQKHLGHFRYTVLLEAQKLLVPPFVRKQLQFNSIKWLAPVVPVYKFCQKLRIDSLIKKGLLPAKYKNEINGLDVILTRRTP